MEMILLLVFLVFVPFGFNESIDDNKQKILNYETLLNSSRSLDQHDEILTSVWQAEFDVRRVDITTKFRMQMKKHKRLALRNNLVNLKWRTCADLHRKIIRNSDRRYFENEITCLKATMTDSSTKKQAVEQIAGEEKKWRRTYRYLLNLCKSENPNNEDDADICLVEHMEKDNYSSVIEGLFHMKLAAMRELRKQLLTSGDALEKCLQIQLLEYVERVRHISVGIYKCYKLSGATE